VDGFTSVRLIGFLKLLRGLLGVLLSCHHFSLGLMYACTVRVWFGYALLALYGCTVRYGGSLEPRPGVQQGAKVERWLADIPAAPVLVDEPFLFQCSCDVMERGVAFGANA
jgi:hypothetical protein